MKTKRCKLVGFVIHKDQVYKFCPLGHFDASSIVNLVDLKRQLVSFQTMDRRVSLLESSFTEMVVRQTHRSPIPLQNLDKLKTDLRDAYG